VTLAVPRPPYHQYQKKFVVSRRPDRESIAGTDRDPAAGTDQDAAAGTNRDPAAG
jgi:hypothetical protein